MKCRLTIATASVLIFAGMSQGQAPAPTVPQVVNTWYQHYLGRPADQAGMNAWAPQFGEVPPQVVLARILSSKEYYDRHGDTPDGLVLALYRDVLGRVPAQLRPQDVEYWVNKMNQYGSAETMIEEFLHDANTDIYNPPATPAVPAAPALPQYAPPVPQYTPPAAPFFAPPAYAPPVQQYTLPVPSPWHWRHDVHERWQRRDRRDRDEHDRR